jgi:hypothetical protein
MYVIVVGQIQRVLKNGRIVTVRPGEGVDVSSRTAKDWLARGWAKLPPKYNADLDESFEVGLVMRGNTAHAPHGFENAVAFAGEWLPYEFNCHWFEAQLPDLRTDLLEVGFALLETWQLVIPLFDYDVLAASLNDAELKAVIHDDRVPLYDPRLMFARRCDEMAALFARFDTLRAGGRDERAVMLQAIYECKPLVYAMPVTWTGGRMVIDD